MREDQVRKKKKKKLSEAKCQRRRKESDVMGAEMGECHAIQRLEEHSL